MVFLIGGAFQILTDSGAIDAGVAWAVKKSAGKYYLLVPVVMLTMSVLGALGVGNNVALAFIPVAIILARKLRLDAIVVMCMMYFGSNVGFSTSPVNPFTVVLGQQISGIPLMSGLGVRCMLWVLFNAIAILWVLRYCKKIRNDPSRSSVGVYEDTGEGDVDLGSVKLSTRHILNLIVLILTFVIFTYGSLHLKWGMSMLGSCMVGMAIVCSIISGMDVDSAARSYVNGCRTMVYSAILIGFASAINIVMTDSNIIHSIIYYMTLPLASVPESFSAVGMFLVNFVFNFFVPSGSGQAYVVMPIMAPAADILGFSRQIAITAFQLGDGFANVLVPTSGLCMGALGMIGLPFEKWFPWAIKIVALFALVSALFLIGATMLGWS